MSISIFMATKKTSSRILAVFLFILISMFLSNGADTMSNYQSISGAETIVSSGGTFELGFFTPGNSSNYYIGIWYKKMPQQTVVWVANRETPISDKYSSHLKFVDGNLVLVNESQATVWSTNTKFISTNLIAVLLDDGNLVLKDSIKSNSKLWQSFENPTNTWLPGAKLMYNKHTKTALRLISWKNSEDPAPGLYAFEMDPKHNQGVILRNRSQLIWATGEWDQKQQYFSSVPDMGIPNTETGRVAGVTYSFVSNINETSFTYFVNNTIFLTRIVMDNTGQLQLFVWFNTEHNWTPFFSRPATACKVDSYCGAYAACNLDSSPLCNCLSGFKERFEKSWSLKDYSGGCLRNIELECGSTNTTQPKEDTFRNFPSMTLPDNPQSVSAGSVDGCKSICLSNCSCTAYAYHDNACFTWTRDLFNMQQLPQGDINGKFIYIRLNLSEFSKKNKGVNYGAIGGSIASALVILLGLILFVVIRIRKRRSTEKARATEGTLVLFGYKDLQSATGNFSETLGRGGFGSVFKGTLADSTVIAVKKLEGINQGEKQFRNEVSTIGNIQHVNLVHLRGFCSEGDKRLLVYEYMANGSLDSHLFSAEKILSWETRYEIALGTAKGLTYLHERCRDCIIHCDIKPENILLAADMYPKVADFGLAKLVGRDFSRVITTMRGTRGYLAPEWISGVAVTAKADVYSYGMMLFEIVSGRRNLEHNEDGTASYFPTRAAKVTIGEGDVLSLLDPKLNGIADIEKLTNLCKVACWCIQDAENVRPSMSQIVQILEGVSEINLPPEPKCLRVFTEKHDNVDFFFIDESSSTGLQTKSNPLSTPSMSIEGVPDMQHEAKEDQNDAE